MKRKSIHLLLTLIGALILCVSISGCYFLEVLFSALDGKPVFEQLGGGPVLEVVLPAGACVDLKCPDYGAWQESGTDRFELINPPAGIWISRTLPQSRVFICRSATAPLDIGTTIDYRYARHVYSSFNGVPYFYYDVQKSVIVLFPSAESRGLISPSADSDTILPGTSTQLHANLTNGTPPFHYEWYPSVVLDRDDIPDPIATLSEGTRFHLTVRDSAGWLGQGDVTVNVNTHLTASATPSVITFGESSQLDVIASGGSPFEYKWEVEHNSSETLGRPRTLSDASIPNPVAKPSATTVYRVNAVARRGNSFEAASTSVRVAVLLSAQASATQPSIGPGESTSLSAIAHGGEPPITYAWTPVESLDDSTSPTPIATPAQTTTYTVAATDSTGATSTAQTTVTIEIPPLAVIVSADFPTIGQEGSTRLHGRVTGGTAPYTYAWTPAGPLRFPNTAEPIASPQATTTFTVLVTDSTGATTTGQTTVTVLP